MSLVQLADLIVDSVDVAVSVGEDAAEEALRSALSLGPERAVRVWGEGVVLADTRSIAAALLAVAVADVPLQIWRHGRGLRMSADEVKREARESDGDPQVKSRIRQRQREAARRRMMSAVPTADVVVTNPSTGAVERTERSW